MDIWSPEKRSAVMARIRGKDTKPELIVRSLLHRSGVRFSLRRKDLPGKPDIVLPKYKTVVFVHGCFWHRHKGCKVATTPKTRTDFWQAKFDSNVARDQRNQRDLKKAGWQVIVLWECEILRDPFKAVEKVLKRIDPGYELRDAGYELPDKRTVLKVAEKRLQWKLGRKAKILKY
jgi:DNA mismatch endonuclease (patch repair protein)